MNIKQYSKKKLPKHQIMFDVTEHFRGVAKMSVESVALPKMFGHMPDRLDAIAIIAQLALDRIAEYPSKAMTCNLAELISQVMGHRSFKLKVDTSMYYVLENFVRTVHRNSGIQKIIPADFYYTANGGKVIRVIQKLFGERFYIVYDVNSVIGDSNVKDS